MASLASATLLLMATGCSEETTLAGSDDIGYISLDLDFDPAPLNAAASKASSSRAGAADVTIDDLTLALTSIDKDNATETFTVSEFGDSHRTATGRYTLEAYYGTSGNEDWDAPYYHGSQELTVQNEKSTPVSLSVSLANSIIDIEYTEAFTTYLTDFNTTVTTASANEFTWAADETRELYVNPGQVIISVAFTKPNGKSATAQLDPISAEARHRYRVTVDADYQKETLNLSFDDTVTETEVEIDISDANLPLLAPAPTVLTDGFTAGETISTISGAAYSSPLTATIAARGNIASAVLSTTSAYLTSKGWPATVDLANAGSAQTVMESLGLSTRGFSGTKSVFGIIDFAGVIPNIRYVDGADNTTTFSLTVTDEQGKSTETELFSVSVGQLVFVVLDSEITEDGKATVTVRYNGASPLNDLTFSALNDRGIVTALPITSVTSGSEADTYTVNLESDLISLNSSLVTTAKANGSDADIEFTMVVPSLRIVEDETNAFATHAYTTVRFTNDEAAAAKENVTIEISTDGGSTYSPAPSTIEGESTNGRSSRDIDATSGTAVYHITGLTASTTYRFRATLNDEPSRSSSLTTEDATQLPDAGFDEWTSEKKGDYQYLWKVNDGSVWGTLNDLTISEFGSGSGNGLSTGGCAYKATSGTIPANSRSTKTTDEGGLLGTSTSADGNTIGNATLHSDKQYKGTNAALIRTVGWGDGNTASGLISGQHFGTCENKTVGELYLGNYNNGSVYGYSFSSRPKSISFYYHYDVVSSGNGDYGTADVSIFDNDGTIIANTSKQLTETSAYTLVEMNIDYSNMSKKASSISIVFKSSGNSDALAENTSFWRCPGVKNVSGGEYVGSELYIDDIVLNY